MKLKLSTSLEALAFAVSYTFALQKPAIYLKSSSRPFERGLQDREKKPKVAEAALI